MDNLHFKSTTTVIFDDQRFVVETINDMFDMLHIPNTDEYIDAKETILRHLLAFRHIDLSRAYGDHNVHVYLKFEEE